MRALRRRSVLGVATIALGLGACSFPDVSFMDAPEASASSASSASSSSSGPGSGGGPTSSQSASATGSGGTGGEGGAGGGAAGSSSASSGTGGGMGGAGGCTDGDGDGHTAEYCGGDDCADGDNRAFPGQTEFFVTPVQNLPPGSILQFDFNCDGGEEGRYTSSECKYGGTCDTASHFLVPNVVSCGEKAEFGKCVSQLLDCPKKVEFVSKLQECR